MIDRENVIKGIQECDLNGGLIGNCPYKGILTLLKEQEWNRLTEDDNGAEIKYMKEYIMQETEETTPIVSAWKRYEPVAELVRCKNCEYNRHDNYCECNHHETKPDWFCADGVKKE